MNLKEYPDREMMMLSLADQLTGELGSFLRGQERVSLAVPGGTTPGPVFDTLSSIELDWSRVDITLTDERWLPETAPRSNTRLVRKRLLQGRAAAARFVPLHADTETPEESIPELTKGLEPILPLSVVRLGMGGNLHIASLFAGADRLAEALSPQAPPLMALRAPDIDEPRVTLTAPVLTAAMNVHILITGPEKRKALDRARRLDPLEAPVRLVLDDATIHWAE